MGRVARGSGLIRRLGGGLEIVTRRKDFESGWLASPTLNRWGLHPARIALSDACLWARRLALGDRPLGFDELRRTGVVAISDFLPTAVFEKARAEARARLRELEVARPFPCSSDRGYRSEHRFPGGWDRCDGDTVNRFVHLDATTPACLRAVRNRTLASLCRAASGFRHRPGRFRIYQTIHGDDDQKRDAQKALHKDTFHSAIKVWLFLDEVAECDGPFHYVERSHRMDRTRYRWEYARANEALTAPPARRGGAFRVAEAELPRLGLGAPKAFTVPANTLVLGDVRGFHRRGGAEVGARRLCLYANLRLNPFMPLAI